jgi:hypothetical protein
MTTAQKSILVITIIAAGVAAYQTSQVANLRNEITRLKQSSHAFSPIQAKAAETEGRPGLASKESRMEMADRAQVRADDRKKELEQFADSLRGKVVVNLGTIQQIGGQMAEMMTARRELRSLKKLPQSSMTPEQGQRLQELERKQATALGMLPEISGFQDDPEQYAGFYSSLISHAAGLTDANAKQVSSYMKSRGEIMLATNLNSSNEPDDPAMEHAWEAKRDAFNEQTVEGIAKIIGKDEALRIGFTPGFLELMEQDFDKAD